MHGLGVSGIFPVLPDLENEINIVKCLPRVSFIGLNLHLFLLYRVVTWAVTSQKQLPNRYPSSVQPIIWILSQMPNNNFTIFIPHLQWIIVALGLLSYLKNHFLLSTWAYILVLVKSDPSNSGVNSLAWDRIAYFIKTQTSCGLTSFQLFVNDNFKRISFNLNKLQGYVPHLHTYKTQ